MLRLEIKYPMPPTAAKCLHPQWSLICGLLSCWMGEEKLEHGKGTLESFHKFSQVYTVEKVLRRSAEKWLGMLIRFWEDQVGWRRAG